MHRTWGMPLRRACFAVIAVGMCARPVWAAEAPSSARLIGTPAQHAQWEAGLALLGQGNVEQAAAAIHRLVGDGVAHESVREVDGWLAGFEKGELGRQDRIRVDGEKYVKWAKQDWEKKSWHEAMWSCGRALDSARDPEAFRKEAWLKEMAADAARAAEGFEQAGQFYKAASLHVRLNELFPHEKQYRQALERCQDHIRLELIFEGESDWQTAVSGIMPEMARDAFRKIATEYLKEPAFKDAAIGGLKQLLLMAGKPKLAGAFKKFEDQVALDEFKIRLGEILRKTEEKQTLSVDALIEDCFDKVLAMNEEVQVLPQTVLVHEFVYGALQPLDKFSDMIWPADLQEFAKHTQGKFSGVGIQIRKLTGEPILVVSPLEDSPAYEKGIRPGDLITKINGRPASKYTINRAVREITGAEGTTVALTFKRPGLAEEFEVTLERKEIIIHTIKGFERDEAGNWKYMVDPAQKIGYVRMVNFTEHTFDELQAVMQRLTRQEGLRGLVFDLRDNPGGPLKSAVDVAEMFLEANRPIVSTRDRYGKPWEVASSSSEAFSSFPMMVLVSKYSASASEIVAGALQVHKRAVIMGERTYGKGSVQQVLPLNRDRAACLKLTTALYYLPNGRCLHKDDDSTTWGVDPDLPAGLVSKERMKLTELQLKKDILKGKNQDRLTEEDLKQVTSYRPASQPAKTDGKTPATQKGGDDKDKGEDKGDDGEGDSDDEDLQITHDDPNDYPEIDPQLEKALLLMRVWLKTDQRWPALPAKVAAAPTTSTGG